MRAALRHWDDGRTTLVVSHGSVLRGLLAALNGEQAAARPATANAAPLHWRGVL